MSRTGLLVSRSLPIFLQPNRIGQYSNNCCNRDNQIKQEKYGERVGGIKYIGGDGGRGFFPISNIEGYPNFDIFLCLPIISPPSAPSSSSASSGSFLPTMIIGFDIFGLFQVRSCAQRVERCFKAMKATEGCVKGTKSYFAKLVDGLLDQDPIP